MASNVPQALATEEAQGPQEAIMDCVGFFTRRGKAELHAVFGFDQFFFSFAVLRF